MHQFGPKDLKPLLDFFNLMGDFFFEIGSFVDLVTDVNVHCQASNARDEPREATVLTKQLYTRWEVVKASFPRVESVLLTGTTSYESYEPRAASLRRPVGSKLGARGSELPTSRRPNPSSIPQEPPPG